MSNYIGHCRQCEYALFADENQITNGADWRKLYPGEARRVKPADSNVAVGVYGRCSTYGHKAFRLYEVKGHYSDKHTCDDRCMNAKGTECTCSCGGANHGRGHAVTLIQAQMPAEPEPISDTLTPKQASFIRKLIDERTMADSAREIALSRVNELTKAQASAWIEKLLTLPKNTAKV